MNGEFPVEMSTGGSFFRERLSETPRIEDVDAPSSFASLDARAAARRISPFQIERFPDFLNCGTSCPSVRRAHWRALLPDRGSSGRSGSVARLHRSPSGRTDCTYAVLRPDAGRGGQASQRVAGPGARPRVEGGRTRLIARLTPHEIEDRTAGAADIEFGSCVISASDSSQSG